MAPRPTAPAPAAAPPPTLPPELAEFDRQLARLRARQAAARDEAAFPAVRHRAGPFRLRQMLPRDAVLLYATANRLFNGAPARTAPLADVAIFIFILTAPPHDGERAHQLHHAWVCWRLFWLYLRRGARARLHAALDDYVFRTFVDWPAAAAANADSALPPAPAPVRTAFFSGLYDLLAARYGWTLRELDSTPLRRLMQCYKHLLAAQYYAAGKTPPSDKTADERAIEVAYIQALHRHQAAAAARN